MNDSERLKFIRSKTGLSQPKFAKEIGILESSVNNIESGKQKISIDLAKLLSDKFQVDFKWLLIGEGSPFLTSESVQEDENVLRIKVKKNQKLLIEYED